jgi:hypothetical protein
MTDRWDGCGAQREPRPIRRVQGLWRTERNGHWELGAYDSDAPQHCVSGDGGPVLAARPYRWHAVVCPSRCTYQCLRPVPVRNGHTARVVRKWLRLEPSNNFTAALANRAVFGAVQSRFREAILQLNATRGKLDNGSLALQASTDAAYAAGTLSMDAIGALFRQNADSIVSSWWDLHNELMATQNQDSGYPAWWLKSPDVRYTRPLEGSTAGQSTGAESATAADSCVHPEVVDELRAKVAELERKLRDLQPHAGGHENYVLE